MRLKLRLAMLAMVATFALLAASACRLPINAADFDQQCDSDDDCVAVIVGDTCRESCEAAGINVDEKQRYDDARGAPCPPRADYIIVASFGCTLPTPVDCDAGEAFCDAGTCASRDVVN